LNRKYATALAFQAASDTVPATRLPLPETPNLAQCPVRRAPIKAKAARHARRREAHATELRRGNCSLCGQTKQPGASRADGAPSKSSWKRPWTA
jgi:hypothetical protein